MPLSSLAREVVDVYADGDPEPVFDVDVPHTCRADRTLTRQLLANLVGNAVKYTPPDRPPHVRIHSIDDAEPGWVQVSVADRGVGIAPGEEQSIFAAFERSARDADTVAGTGLGLALCHSIVVRHGGRIWAEGNDDGGATFRFTLPRA